MPVSPIGPGELDKKKPQKKNQVFSSLEKRRDEGSRNLAERGGRREDGGREGRGCAESDAGSMASPIIFQIWPAVCRILILWEGFVDWIIARSNSILYLIETMSANKCRSTSEFFWDLSLVLSVTRFKRLLRISTMSYRAMLELY